MSSGERDLRPRSSNKVGDLTRANRPRNSLPTIFSRRNKIIGINDIVTNEHVNKIKLETDFNSERIKQEVHDDNWEDESADTIVRNVTHEEDLNFNPSTEESIFIQSSSVDNSIPDSVESLDRKSVQARIENLKNLAKQKTDEIAILTEDLAKLNAEIEFASNITFPCHICDKSITAFETCCEDEINVPVKSENDSVMSIKGKKQIVFCLICNKPFGNKKSRSLHNRIHVPKKSKEERLKKPKKRKRKKRSVISAPVKTPYDPSKRKKRIRIDFNADPALRIKRGRKSKPCPICGKINIKGMAEHIRMHTGEKPFECEFCTRKFLRITGLQEHRHRHTGERPYQCQVCYKRFAQRATLYNHRSVHAKEKAFSCDICQMRFTLKRSVKYHKLKIHASGIASELANV